MPFGLSQRESEAPAETESAFIVISAPVKSAGTDFERHLVSSQRASEAPAETESARKLCPAEARS